MRKIGLIGGMSWISTAIYYERINRGVQRQLGNYASAHLLIESVNFADYVRLQDGDDWDAAAGLMQRSAARLEAAGATAILICSNAMHKVYDSVDESVGVPVIHIADTVAKKMLADKNAKATLIGTRNVMTEGFYRRRLVGQGIALTPPDEGRVEEIDRIIYDELMHGNATGDARRTMKTLLTNIAKQDTKAVILGCTELNMVVDTKANVLPIYDSAIIHADAAVEWILGDG